MATVYLAQDDRHHRRMAVKVLRPGIVAALGPERFLREIEIAAQLKYPPILPLLDSGAAGKRHLTLRENPDYPPWRATRDSVLRELAQLVTEARH